MIKQTLLSATIYVAATTITVAAASGLWWILTTTTTIIVPVNALYEAENIQKQPEAHIPAILIKIAECESGNRQFDENGKVIHGAINPLDVGRWQINLGYHAAAAARLGFDLESADGNLAYALWLYEREGTRPWSWSKHCWLSDMLK